MKAKLEMREGVDKAEGAVHDNTGRDAVRAGAEIWCCTATLVWASVLRVLLQAKHVTKPCAKYVTGACRFIYSFVSFTPNSAKIRMGAYSR